MHNAPMAALANLVRHFCATKHLPTRNDNGNTLVLETS